MQPKKIPLLSEAGISFQDAAVSVVTKEHMQEGKANVEIMTRALQD